MLSPPLMQCTPRGVSSSGGGGGGQRKLPAVTRSDPTFLPSDLHPDHLCRNCQNTEN